MRIRVTPTVESRFRSSSESQRSVDFPGVYADEARNMRQRQPIQVPRAADTPEGQNELTVQLL